MLRPALLIVSACGLAACEPPPPVAAPVPETVTIVPQPPLPSRPERTLAQQVRLDIREGRSVPDDTLRRLADGQGDSFAAYRYADRLSQRGAPVSDVAHYYAIAAEGGAGGSISNLIRQMGRPGAAGIPAARLDRVERILVRAAENGDDGARGFLATSYRSGAPFGRDEARATAFQATDARTGDTDSALDLTYALLQKDTLTEEDRVLAQEMIEIADASDDVQAKTLALNLRRLLASSASADGSDADADADAETQDLEVLE